MVTSLLEIKQFYGNDGIKVSAQYWNIQYLISCFIINHANDLMKSTKQKRFYALKLFSKIYSSLTVTLFVLTLILEVDILNYAADEGRGKKKSVPASKLLMKSN